ncbi:hypothetical protein GCM10023084_69140 [Streptomyces lacrimifluminis]|uniref:Uncharacterized protein n=1 Tax=Streptomyces lacrimifluminis TaxID=1500077 RepID=A0A917P400_9ACTN|nr:hypothetical protein [Streptomyces lacrimifluminis]GGJ60528.1 hypothetical protein GCM10012282_67240 [Streptomyces lacrimifluminis]
MSTRTTRFEDRLLAELKREIELREGLSTEVDTGGRGTNTPVGRLVTPRRIALVAATCAVAGLAMVLVPGTSADSVAYAVESHGDGSVTLTIKDQKIGIEAQNELAEKLRPKDIQVMVNVLAPGYVCDYDVVVWATGKQGKREPIVALQWNREITLGPGNVLVFENLSGHTEPHRVNAYTGKREIKPCVPVKSAP